MPSNFQLNDFHAHDMSPNQDAPPGSLAVIVKWIGHPGSSPRDPRARQFFVRWNDPPPPKALVDQAIDREQPVVRWDLRCAGIHDLDFSDPVPARQPEKEGELADDDEGDLSDADSEEPESKPSRWKDCSTLVKLHVSSPLWLHLRSR
jgi:hypothetical protein